LRQTVALAILAALAGVASLVAGGPVPGDVGITRALQSLLGAEPVWAELMTQAAKAPRLWGTLGVGAAFFALIAG
jgi:hypothetical protein